MVDDRLEELYLPAALKALEEFAVEAEDVELVTHSENLTFRVSVRGSDSDYVLRLHRPGYNSLAELDSERMWVQALRDAGLPVQDSLRTSQGRHFARVDIPANGERRFAGMTTWLEGTLLSEYLDTVSDPAERGRIFHRMGGFAASLHNQSSAWTPPPGFERRRLGIDGLLGEDPFWGRFWEHSALTISEQAALLRERDQLRPLLLAYGKSPENFGLIHADLHPDNVIYDGNSLALIDFDDAAYGWHMYDVASMLIEYCGAPDFRSLSAAVLEGYREHRPLAQRDFEMLPAFLRVRGMAIIGWFHQRPEHQESDYFEKVKAWLLEACQAARR